MAQKVNLVCILSDQLIPNILSVHHYNDGDKYELEHLKYFESSAMKTKNKGCIFKQTIYSSFKEQGKRVPQFHKNSEGKDGFDNFDIKAMTEFFYTEIKNIPSPSNKTIINVTGGNKLMALAASGCYRRLLKDGLDVKLIYIDIDKHASILDLSEDAEIYETRITHFIKIDEFINASGFAITKGEIGKTPVYFNDCRFSECAMILAMNLPYERAFEYDDKEREYKHGVPPKAKNTLEEMLREGVIDAAKINCFLSGVWLELFMYHAFCLLSASNVFPLDDVKIGIKVEPMCQGKQPTGNNPDEYDVVFTRKQKLYTFECKTGKHDGHKSKDFIYKMIARVQQFQALNAIPVLATVSKSATCLPDSDKKNERVFQLAKLLRCKIMEYDRIRELAVCINEKRNNDAAAIIKGVLGEQQN